MRISTSIYAVEAALGKELFLQVSEEYAQEWGKPLSGERMGWHWVLAELDVPMPKSAAYLIKSDPAQHLAIGFSRGRYELRLNAKPESGKVWVSSVLPGTVIPKEVGIALQKRAAPTVGSKWPGLMVEIFMPMHQKHPGLAEHAIIGGMAAKGGDVLYFVSDRPDPMLAPMWHVYRFHPSKRVAQALLSVVDKNGQRDFRSTLVGQELVLRDYEGVKMDEEAILASLKGVKKFVWKTDASPSPATIPQNARRFKLGEELCAHEAKSMPAEAFIDALNSMRK